MFSTGAPQYSSKVESGVVVVSVVVAEVVVVIAGIVIVVAAVAIVGVIVFVVKVLKLCYIKSLKRFIRLEKTYNIQVLLHNQGKFSYQC